MSTDAFVDRRQESGSGPQSERRQFANTYADLSPAARELGEAVDQYKLVNRRRFVTYEEILEVMLGLGYHK